jgi:hypothetical protein
MDSRDGSVGPVAVGVASEAEDEEGTKQPFQADHQGSALRPGELSARRGRQRGTTPATTAWWPPGV